MSSPPGQAHLRPLRRVARLLDCCFKLTAESSGPFSSASLPVEGDGTHVTTTRVPVYTGHGLNTRSLPAGYSPPDRFVKMFLLKQTAVAHAPPKSLDDGLVAVTGLLNTVHIVRGTVTGGPSWSPKEYTNWACVKVPRSPNGSAEQPAPLFYYRTYDNMQWKKIEVGKVDFTRGTTHKPIPLYEPGLGVKDVTPA